MVACAVFAVMQTGWSATYNSVRSGDWASTSTWNTILVPGSSVAGDVAYVKGHSVTSSAAVAYNLNGLGLLTTGSVLRMQSGSSMTVTGMVTLSYGNLIVESNASLSHVSASGYIRIANQGNGQTGSLTINGGTVTSGRTLLIGAAGAQGAQGTLTINSGSLTVTNQLQLGAGTNSSAMVFLNGGAAQVDYLTFMNYGTGQTQSLTMVGGQLTLTTGNEAGSLQFTDTGAKVWFEGGIIVFKGVDTSNDFTAFKTTFNNWVDAGNLDSAVFSDQQLKSGLVFNGADAVLYSGLASFTGTLYVATNGNNGWSGTALSPSPQGIDGPLATLTGARDRIRQMKEAGWTGSVTVFVRNGTYYESETLVLEPQDSGTAEAPVVYKAYPGESPIISGGRKLASPTLNPDGSYSVSIPEAAGWQWRFRQLFIDGRRYTLARSPNTGYFYVQGIPPAPASPYYDEPYWFCHNFIFNPGDLQNWSTLGSNDVSIRAYASWDECTVWLSSADETNHTAFTESHVLAGLDPADQVDNTKRYIIENAPGSLDAPGEWQLDRQSGVLTVIPFNSENLSVKSWVAPLTIEAIKVAGDPDTNSFVENIRFEDLTFSHYAEPVLTSGLKGGWKYGQAASGLLLSAVNVTGGRNLEFLRCEISHIGTHAVQFGRGCVSNRIEQCHIYDMGGGGIYVGERVQSADGYSPGTYGQTGYNIVYNNYIHDGGVLHLGAVGVLIGQSSDNRVAHNEISFFNWSGMQIGWTWDASPTWTYNNIIECNSVHDVGRNVLSDLAGIYTVGENLNTVVRSNVICRVFTWQESQGKGIYPDQATSGVTFSYNLVYDAGSYAFGVNFCRSIDVVNNVFAMSYGKAPFMFGWRADAAIIRNIFYYPWGSVYGDNANKILKDWFRQCDSNLYWRVGGRPVTFQALGTSKVANTNLLDFAAWKTATGLDAHSLVSDPLFTDPLNGDFTFKDASVAESIGFTPVDWSVAGLEGSPAWIAMPEQFARPVSYEAYKSSWPEKHYPVSELDTVLSLGFSMVQTNGQQYGALCVRKIKIPADPGYEVQAADSLLNGSVWSPLTAIHSMVDYGISEAVTVRDTVPASSAQSRFYRVRAP